MKKRNFCLGCRFLRRTVLVTPAVLDSSSHKVFSLALFFPSCYSSSNSLAPDPHALSSSQTHAVSLLLRVPDSSCTNTVAEFLHTPHLLTLSFTLKTALLPPAVVHPHQSFLLLGCDSPLMKILSTSCLYSYRCWPLHPGSVLLLVRYTLLPSFDISIVLCY